MFASVRADTFQGCRRGRFCGAFVLKCEIKLQKLEQTNKEWSWGLSDGPADKRKGRRSSGCLMESEFTRLSQGGRLVSPPQSGPDDQLPAGSVLAADVIGVGAGASPPPCVYASHLLQHRVFGGLSSDFPNLCRRTNKTLMVQPWRRSASLGRRFPSEHRGPSAVLEVGQPNRAAAAPDANGIWR